MRVACACVDLLLSAKGHIAITDFGLAKEDMTAESRASTFCGTVEYMSPEMVRGKEYTRASDWWSVGVLIYDMLTGQPPFQARNRKTLQKKICSAKIKLPTYVSKEAHSIMRGLMERDASKRLGSNIVELKRHPWFRDINWRRLLHGEVPPPFVPNIERGALDFSNFSPRYTDQLGLSCSPEHPPSLSQSQEMHFLGFSYTRTPSPGQFRFMHADSFSDDSDSASSASSAGNGSLVREHHQHQAAASAGAAAAAAASSSSSVATSTSPVASTPTDDTDRLHSQPIQLSTSEASLGESN
jgi:serine/threonine protein kinase